MDPLSVPPEGMISLEVLIADIAGNFGGLMDYFNMLGEVFLRG